MANFSRSELTRRKARLERRLEFLQDRLERNGLADGSHDSAECSALQTALVLFDEELERVDARAGQPCEHQDSGPGPWLGADRTVFCHRCPVWYVVGRSDWRTGPRPEQNGRVQVPPTAGDLRPPKVPPPLALALFSVPGVRAWDLHWTNGGCDVRVFVDAQADGLAVAKALHGALESTMATRGEIEITITDACDRPRLTVNPPDMVIESALVAARSGPCRKSRRGAVAFLMHYPKRRIPGHNRPASPTSPCDGSPACRAACGQVCNHAEENVVLEWLRSGAARDGGHAFDVLHIEVDQDGEPLAFDRPGKPSRPSCITCARLMFAAGVRCVWLLGVAGWRSWTAHEFLLETMAELGLPGGST